MNMDDVPGVKCCMNVKGEELLYNAEKDRSDVIFLSAFWRRPGFEIQRQQRMNLSASLRAHNHAMTMFVIAKREVMILFLLEAAPCS